MLHVPSALFFKLTPYRIFRSVIVEEFFSIAVKHSHLVDLVYGWSKTQIFPRTIAHISLKKRREVLRYLSLLEIHPPLRQNLMLGILYGAVFLNVGINQLVQISSVSLSFFGSPSVLQHANTAGITNAACQRRQSSIESAPESCPIVIFLISTDDIRSLSR